MNRRNRRVNLYRDLELPILVMADRVDLLLYPQPSALVEQVIWDKLNDQRSMALSQIEESLDAAGDSSRFF